MKRNNLALLVILVLAISLSCSLTQGEQPRTYYEGLDLETPEEAVETFVDAFQRDDFFTVYLVLSSRTQSIMMQNLRLFQYRQFFQIEHREEVFEDVSEFTGDPGDREHADMGWYFDELMLAAKENDALLIDLSGEVTILDSEDSESVWEDDTLDLITEVEGIDGEVIFRMVQAPSDRWRVLQVLVEDGDERMIPWAIPKEPEPIIIEASAVIQVPCTDNPPPPSQAIPGQPYLLADPTCGNLTSQDLNGNTVPGTTLNLTGSGFEPNTETEIFWELPIGNQFHIRHEGENVIITTDDEGNFQVEVVMHQALVPSSANGDTQLHQIIAKQEIPVNNP